MSRKTCLATLVVVTASGLAAWWVKDAEYGLYWVAVQLYLRLFLAAVWPV